MVTIVRDSEPMGSVIVSFTVSNRIDEGRAEAGDIPAEQVRSVAVENVLVDTGATTLCLPADLIARPGLTPLREVAIATATGLGRSQIFRDATIRLFGRETTTECIELPEGSRPLLGVIPLKRRGLNGT